MNSSSLSAALSASLCANSSPAFKAAASAISLAFFSASHLAVALAASFAILASSSTASFVYFADFAFASDSRLRSNSAIALPSASAASHFAVSSSSALRLAAALFLIILAVILAFCYFLTAILFLREVFDCFLALFFFCFRLFNYLFLLLRRCIFFKYFLSFLTNFSISLSLIYLTPIIMALFTLFTFLTHFTCFYCYRTKHSPIAWLSTLIPAQLSAIRYRPFKHFLSDFLNASSHNFCALHLYTRVFFHSMQWMKTLHLTPQLSHCNDFNFSSSI